MSASSKSSPELVRHTLAELPKLPESTKKWRILLLVSAVNSLSQRVATYLSDLGFENTSIQLALTDEDVLGAVIAHQPHIVLCPFLTKKVPDQVWQNVITLIVHPGPPGDAGPAALDWAILGDLGTESDAAAALKPLTAGPLDRTLPVEQRQRTHWGITVLQADETMDGGPVWAYDQFPIPDVSKLTKSVLYQGEVSHAVLRSVTAAIGRIAAVVEKQCDPTRPGTWVDARVDPKWARECVSYGQPFLGGPLNERPQIKPGQRRPNLATHTAADVARIINCGDGQPGATLATAKSFLFAYDAHIHYNVDKLPPSLWVERGFASFEDIPAGTAIATRSGAVLFKTAPCTHGATCAYECGVAVWLTHGRVPKAANTGALKPKVPLTEALVSAGEGTKVDGVHEWPLVDFGEVTGTWQQVFVRTIEEAGALIQLVYWDYYNGAMSTTGCQQLVRGLQWATNPARGNVKMLVLMGGQYFSNGVALNIIEAAEHPGKETWDNINAIDDVVELVAGDSSPERSPFLQGTPSLTERGIVTVTVARGNAAAGGVAFAVASDIVIAANTVVFNPAYRGMGLHGSELHLWSYVERCGRDVATHMARDMLPISASYAQQLGLVDIVIGGRDSSRSEVDALAIDVVRTIARTSASEISQATSSWFTSAPWTRPGPGSLLQTLIHNKRTKFASSEHIPLLHYRQEELAQMLLDNFHPVRSERYHSRRIKFVRKVKADKTANRFVNHGSRRRTQDEEEMAAFDDAPGHVRGEEWEWVGLPVPPSFATSAPLRIDFAAVVPPLPPYHSPKYPSSEDSASSVDEHEHPSAHRRPVSPASAASTSSVPPTPAEAEAPAVQTSKLDGKLSGPATKYQRPIVTNEGNTENPCLFNTASA